MNQLNTKATSSVTFIRRHRSFFAGIFLLLPAVVIPLLLIYTLMKAEFMQGWCHLHVTGDNAYGLIKGSPVTISGMTIGHIERVSLLKEGAVAITFKIQRSYQHLVRKDTHARFQQKSPVVGEWVIELTGGSETAAIVEEADTLEAVLPFRFDTVIRQVTSVVSLVESLVGDIQEGKGTVGQLLKKDTLAGIVNELGRDIDRLMETVGLTLCNVDSLLKELTVLGRSGNGMIDSFGFVAGEVRGSLDQVGAILENIRGASGNVTPMLNEVQDRIREVDGMMHSLQQSWIYRKIDGKRDDPMLKGDP